MKLDLMKNSNGERIWIGTYKDAEEDIWLHIDDTEVSIEVEALQGA